MKVGPLVTEFCHLALGGLVIMTHRVVQILILTTDHCQYFEILMLKTCQCKNYCKGERKLDSKYLFVRIQASIHIIRDNASTLVLLTSRDSQYVKQLLQCHCCVPLYDGQC